MLNRIKTPLAALLLCVLILSGCSSGDTGADVPPPAASSSQTPSGGGDGDGGAVPADTLGVTISDYDVSSGDYALTIDAGDRVHDISELLFGIFIEDINFAADGGLYPELVQNRSFEFTELASGDQKHAWSDVGKIDAVVTVGDADGGLNRNNTNYMVLENKSDKAAGIANRGFLEGMAVKQGTYKFSIYAKALDYQGAISIDIMSGNSLVAGGTIDGITGVWAKYELSLVVPETATRNVTLQVTIGKGRVAIDMVSLFPADTYKGRENGLRRDLAEKLEALEPAFVRFPGGCIAEGLTLELAFDWKDSIGVDEDRQPLFWNGTYGDVAARRQGQSIWTDENTSSDKYPSFFTYGLGFFEYFQLAEDMGALGVPVINCGLSCMGQGVGTGPAIGTEEFNQYIRDALDLVEFCRGGADTPWGAARIAMGRPEPFNLKYICVGNEQWENKYFTRYAAFVEAFDEARRMNPALFEGIELIYSSGVDDGDSGYSIYMPSYEYAAQWLERNPGKSIDDFAGATDHHYYNEPSWFFSHTDYYDEANYSRSVEDMTSSRFGGAIKVFLGEYAARSNQWRSALAEAAYMTGLERNGDIVVMSAYAPLFGNLVATHWSPDLIWFTNQVSTNSVNYYVQQAFAMNAGTTLLSSKLTGAELDQQPLGGRVGVGTWNTAASFANVIITSNATGETLASQDFGTDKTQDKWTKISDGRWNVKDGQLQQTNTSTNTGAHGTTGTAAYFGDNTWTNYTYELEATKISGAEGFLIPFAVTDKSNNYFWNIGGWNNTVSCLQHVEDGIKSDRVGGTVRDLSINTGQTYKLKIIVESERVRCYIDDVLYVDHSPARSSKSEAYQVVSTDDTGDVIIKLVNVTDTEKAFSIDIKNAFSIGYEADVYLVAGKALTDDNKLGQDELVSLESATLSGLSERFNLNVPKYSVTILRVRQTGG